MPAGSELTLPDDYPELAAYAVAGKVAIDDQAYADGMMAVRSPGKTLTLTAIEGSRVMIVGGEQIGDRHIWWNFVSSSKERIEQAKADWREMRFDKVPDEDEFIPLPE